MPWASRTHYHQFVPLEQGRTSVTGPAKEMRGWGAAEFPGGKAATIEKVLVTAGAYLLAMGVWHAMKRRR